MTDADKGLEMIVTIGIFTAVAGWAFGATRGKPEEPLPEWKRRSEEAYPVGGPGPGGVGIITDPGIVSYGGLEMPVQPPGWHEEIIEERLEEGLPHEAIVEEYGLPPPPPPAEKATEEEIIEAGGRPLILAQGGPPVLDPRSPGYQKVLNKLYVEEIEAIEEHRAASRKLLGLRDYVPPVQPRETGGRR